MERQRPRGAGVHGPRRGDGVLPSTRRDGMCFNEMHEAERFTVKHLALLILLTTAVVIGIRVLFF